MQSSKFTKFISLIFILLAFTSCGSKLSSTTFKITKVSFLSGATVASDFDGGVLIFGKNNETGEAFQVALDPTSADAGSIELSFGSYSVKAFGWHDGTTPTNLSGTQYCADITTEIRDSEATMNLSLSQAACSTMTDVTVYNNDPGLGFKIEACHGVVKIIGKGQMPTCAEAPSIAQSIKIEYVSLNTDGTLDLTKKLASQCLTNTLGYDYLPSAYTKVIKGGAGFKNPMAITAYLGTNCDDAGAVPSMTKVIPAPINIPSHSYFNYKKNSTGINLMVGFDSCLFDTATTNTPFAAGGTAGDFNIICSLPQFNQIANYPDKKFLIAKTIDFIGAAPATQAAAIFSGGIQGDISMYYNNVLHLKGASDSLFELIGSNVADAEAKIENLNIDVSSITSGPIIAKQAKYNSQIEEINIIGEMTNNDPSTMTSGTSAGDTCGGLINQVFSDAAGASVNTKIEFERINLKNFILNCASMATANTPNYIGALLGAAATINTDSANNRSIHLRQLTGDITINTDSTSSQQYLGGLIGFSENMTDVEASALNYSFVHNSNTGEPRIIGGLLGSQQSMAGQVNGQGSINIRGVAIHNDIKTSLAYNTIQGAGGIIGKSFNPAKLSIENTILTGSINTTLKNAGGLIGHSFFQNTTGYFNLRNSLNTATINSAGSAGGFVGAISLNGTNASFENLNNKGSITGASDGTSTNEGVGGILGTFEDDTNLGYLSLKYSANLGEITATKGMASNSAAGSLVGVSVGINKTYNGNYNYAGGQVYTNSALKPLHIGLVSGASLTSMDIESAFYETNISYPAVTSYTGSEVLLEFGDTSAHTDFTLSEIASTPIIANLTDSQIFTTTGFPRSIDFMDRFAVFDSSGRAIRHGGEGSPFLINSRDDLPYVSSIFGANFNWKLMVDIDMLEGFLQLGHAIVPFNGSFDGNGKTISNFKNNYSTLPIAPQFNGVFPVVSNGRIRDLTLKSGIMDFECSSAGAGGVLVGQIDGSQMGTNDRAIIQSINLINNNLSGGNGCDTVAHLIGQYTTDADHHIFENISIRNNTIDASGSLVAGGLIGVMYNNSGANMAFNIKNIELINNQFISPSSTYGFVASNGGANPFILTYENTLFIGTADSTYNPFNFHKDAGATSVSPAPGNNYVFAAGTPVGLDTSIMTNSTTYALTDIAATTFGDYFIHDATLGTVELNKALIKEELEY